MRDNPEKCRETLYTCVQIIANLSILLGPFLTASSAKIKAMLKIEAIGWNYIEILSGSQIGEVAILFERIDKKVIDEEIERLKW